VDIILVHFNLMMDFEKDLKAVSVIADEGPRGCEVIRVAHANGELL
jgi:hypothetical protein